MRQKTYPLLSVGFLRSYLITMRPYLLFISGGAGWVGLAFIEDPQTGRMILAFIPLFLSYGFGQALTDSFQTDTDALSASYRPLVKGIISRKQVLTISLAGLLLGVIILTYLNPTILVLGMLAVIGLLSYTFFKRTWWGGPPWNSWIVALLPIMGRLIDKNYRIIDIIDLQDSRSLAFLFAILAIFFGYANFVIMGYFKDISADRSTGYHTFPVVFGWKAAALYSDITAGAAAILTGLVLAFIPNHNILGIAIFVIAVIINLFAQIRIHQTRDENHTHGPIANVVRAFILYSLAIIASLNPNGFIWIVAFYILFEGVLRLRPERRQV